MSGSNKYTPIWNGLWTEKHIRKMGVAIYLFGQLLSQSKGNPKVEVTYTELIEIMGTGKRTLENWMKKLKAGNYILVDGKNPMIITINKYRKTKNPKIPSLEGQDLLKNTPPKLVVSVPPNLVEERNSLPLDQVETQQKLVVPNSTKPLNSNNSKSFLKIKNIYTNESNNFGAKNKPKTSSKSDHKKSKNPDVKSAVDFYHNEFLRIHNLKPTLNGAAAKTFQSLLEKDGRPIEELKSLITSYLLLDDHKLKEAGYPVIWFPSRINGLMLKQKQPERGFVY